jgi:hypothetical protein
LLAAGPALGAQTGSIAGRLVAKATREPLAFGIVGIPGLGRDQFTSDSGTFFLGDVPAGNWTIRVRRLGFEPAEIPVVVQPGITDTVRVELARIAVQLLRVNVRAYPPCRHPGAPDRRDTTLATVFEQLRMNALQYKLLADQYPFYYMMETVYSRRMKSDGEVRFETREIIRVDARPGWRYKPGAMIRKERGDRYLTIPGIMEFADDVFIRNHCYHYAGNEMVGEVELIRVDVVASERIREPDVNGSIYIHPITFQVQRSFLELSRPVKEVKDLTALEITTDFKEILPSLPIIAKVRSVQSFDPAGKGDADMSFEDQELADVRWIGRKPGESRKPQ